MVGKTFSRRPARALRSKGFSVARICEMVLPFRKTLFANFPVSSFASERQRLMLSGFMPTSMPVKVLPMVVVTMTVLSTNAAISVKYFLCANDKFLTPLLLYEIALALFIFDLEINLKFPSRKQQTLKIAGNLGDCWARKLDPSLYFKQEC